MPSQLASKQARVTDLLSRAANPVPREVWIPAQASEPARFRNKAKMAVSQAGDELHLGLARPDGTSVDLRTCPLHVAEIEQALPVLDAHARALGLEPYSITARRGELKYLLVTASPDGELMVRWVLRSRRHLPALAASLPALRRWLPRLAVASVNLQPVHQAVIEGEEEIVLTARDRLTMRLHLPQVSAHQAADHLPACPGAARGGTPTASDDAPPPSRDQASRLLAPARTLPLELPTRSFFQTNTAVAAALYATATAWCQEATGNREATTVWDLFCGVGGFALALAGPGRRVLGVEVSTSAIQGARHAATAMGLTDQQVRFEAGDARVLDPARALPDLLVVNPPRRGIGADLATRIEAAGVERVLYSSCNPASLARDLAVMPSYQATRARLFDMFPHTDHAEVLIELRRRDRVGRRDAGPGQGGQGD